MGNTWREFWGPFFGWLIVAVGGVAVTAATITAVAQTGDLRPLPIAVLGVGTLAVAAVVAYGWTIPETRRRWTKVQVTVNIMWVAVIIISSSAAFQLSWMGREGPFMFSLLALTVVSLVGLLVQAWLIPTWGNKTKLAGDVAWLASALLAAATAATGGLTFASDGGGEIYKHLILAAALIGSIAVQHWIKRQRW